MLTVGESQNVDTGCSFIPDWVRMDPVLKTISDIIDKHPEVLDLVRSDLTRGLKNPRAGRKGLPPSQVLRSIILMRYKDYSFRELRDRINNDITFRQFTRFNEQKVPNHRAFNEAHNRLTSKTMRAINNLIVEGARALGLEDGKKLRGDTTVAETDIHYPTDASLLSDTVRVVTRLVRRLIEKVEVPVEGFRDRTKSARRRMQEIQRMSPKKREKQQAKKYKELINTTTSVVESARSALQQTQNALGEGPTGRLAIDGIRDKISHFCALGDKVIDQARRRVFENETVPPKEKIYSIFEPHTDLIIRGKARTPMEFGHKILLCETAIGLVSQYEVLDGNPSDESHVEPILKRHRQTFEHAPETSSFDRGFFSETNVKACKDNRVKLPCIPQRGGKRTPQREAYEKSPEFKEGQRFRAGIEGTISVLFRGRGMKRCLAEGRERFEVFVASAVLTNNLMRIAELLNKRATRKRKTVRRKVTVGVLSRSRLQ